MNALRFFERRRNRVWGARTIGSDPEWKYVNVRRLFIYIEHSIDKHTQWAVFEPNNDRLWANIRRAIEDFLLVLWRDGALLGEKPEHAQLVRCDRTTMTRNELDNGCPYRKTCTRDSLRFSSLSNSLRSGDADPCLRTSFDTAGESALGCASHPRRVAKARDRRESVHRRQVHGSSPSPTVADLPDVSRQPRRPS